MHTSNLQQRRQYMGVQRSRHKVHKALARVLQARLGACDRQEVGYPPTRCLGIAGKSPTTGAASRCVTAPVVMLSVNSCRCCWLFLLASMLLACSWTSKLNCRQHIDMCGHSCSRKTCHLSSSMCVLCQQYMIPLSAGCCLHRTKKAVAYLEQQLLAYSKEGSRCCTAVSLLLCSQSVMLHQTKCCSMGGRRLIQAFVTKQ